MILNYRLKYRALRRRAQRAESMPRSATHFCARFQSSFRVDSGQRALLGGQTFLILFKSDLLSPLWCVQSGTTLCALLDQHLSLHPDNPAMLPRHPPPPGLIVPIVL